MFLESKGWMVQEFYNEYLELKQDIGYLKAKMDYVPTPQDEAALREKVERMRYVLNELKMSGIDLADLLLLSMGIDVDVY